MDPWDPRAAGGGLTPAGGAPMVPGGVMPAGPAMGGVPGGTYKTRMCQMWEQGGACPYGDRCTFAHGAHELVGGGGGIPPNRLRTRPCNKFNTPAGCPYGDRCTFLHAEAPVLALPAPGMEFGLAGGMPGAGRGRGRGRGSVAGALPERNVPGENVPLNYRTRLCMRFDSEAGCHFGDKCHFAHGAHQLRDVSDNIAANRASGRGGGGGARGIGTGRGATFSAGSGAVPFILGGSSGAPEMESLVLAQVRAACVNPRNSPWVRSGGSDVYGDNIMAQLMDILRA